MPRASCHGLSHVSRARRTLAFSGTPCLANALAMSLAGAPFSSARGLLAAPCVDMEMTDLAKSRRSSSEMDGMRRLSWNEPSCAREARRGIGAACSSSYNRRRAARLRGARLCELRLAAGQVVVEVGTVETAELRCVLHRVQLRSDDVTVDVQAVCACVRDAVRVAVWRGWRGWRAGER